VKRILSIFSLLLAGAIIPEGSVLTATAQIHCPECFFNQHPFVGSSTVSESGINRMVINVAFDSSWGATTNTTVWNAAFGCSGCSNDGAANMWNDQRDGSTNNSADTNGWPTHYKFQPSSTTTADVIIDNPSIDGGCAGVDLNSTQRTGRKTGLDFTVVR